MGCNLPGLPNPFPACPDRTGPWTKARKPGTPRKLRQSSEAQGPLRGRVLEWGFLEEVVPVLGVEGGAEAPQTKRSGTPGGAHREKVWRAATVTTKGRFGPKEHNVQLAA